MMAENGNRLWCLAKSIKAWSVLLGSVVAIYGSASFLGVNLPRPAWASEVQLVDSKANTNTVNFLKYTLDQHKAERRQINREKDQAFEKGQTPSPRLIEDEDDVNTAINNINARLKKLRGW